MKPPFNLAKFIQGNDIQTWIRRGLLIGTGLLIAIYGYLFLPTGNSVPKSVRTDLLNAKLSHFQHNHKKALKQLQPFRRFEKHPESDLFKRASQLKKNVKTVLKRQDRIRDQYIQAMKHRVPDTEQTKPPVAREELSKLKEELDRIWNKHQQFLTEHEETATPYSKSTGSMLELLLHRLVRLENPSDSSYARFFRYRNRIYSTYIEASRQKVEQSGDTPYQKTLTYVLSTIDSVKDTVFHPEAKQILIHLRKKMADHFERVDQDVQNAIQKHDYDQARTILNKQKSLFKNVSPWDQFLENRENMVSRLQELNAS